MANFDKKEWLDKHVVPLLAGKPPLFIYHPFWNGIPPKDVLVILTANKPKRIETDIPHEDDGFDGSAWPHAVKRLIDENEFRFDYTREALAIQHEGSLFNMFGGDGAPLFNPAGLVSVRLFLKIEDIGLILQITCHYPSTTDIPAGNHASAAVKAFYALFDVNPLEVCHKHGALFGQA